jgi:hypothetical protein
MPDALLDGEIPGMAFYAAQTRIIWIKMEEKGVNV